MKKIKRVFLFVLDSLGIGGASDAKDFGDEGADTLRSVSSCGASLPNLSSLGLSLIDGIDYLPKALPSASYARLTELSLGKDTTVGHFELMGLLSHSPMPTYPEGFPCEILEKLKEISGRGVLVNLPYSGTEVIRDYGEEHMRTGDLILYTSADSVLQIAAHEEIVPLPELYEICRKMREALTGEHAVGRVIARPFIGSVGNFKRTANRRDFSLEPPRETLLDAMKKKGFDVISVGKISDIFAGRGITESHPTHSNGEGMAKALEIQKRGFTGLCFINLVDFDMLYGHRQDALGYAKALTEFDTFIPEFIRGMLSDDLLIITADHGCDPSDESTDHTRENVPLIIYNEGITPENLGTQESFCTVAMTVADALGVNYNAEAGRSAWKDYENV